MRRLFRRLLMGFTPKRVKAILAQINMYSPQDPDDLGEEVDRVTRETERRVAAKKLLAAQTRALLQGTKK